MKKNIKKFHFTGQERFTWMTRVYYKDAHGCVIMFDLTNKNSFVNTLKWKRDVDSKCTLPDGRPIPCMLLANKVIFIFFFLNFLLNSSLICLCFSAICQDDQLSKLKLKNFTKKTIFVDGQKHQLRKGTWLMIR